jgi:hypothetical protein
MLMTVGDPAHFAFVLVNFWRRRVGNSSRERGVWPMSAVMAKQRTLGVTIGLTALASTIAGCAAIEDIVEQAEGDERAPGTTVYTEPYEAVLLDGSTITISHGDGAFNDFTEGVPSAIHSLNLLAQEGDCHKIEDDAESWAAQSSGTEEGRMASAFANHGESVYAYIECGKRRARLRRLRCRARSATTRAMRQSTLTAETTYLG